MTDVQVYEKLLSYFTWGGWQKGRFSSFDHHGETLCLVSGIRKFATTRQQRNRIYKHLAHLRELGTGPSWWCMAKLIHFNDQKATTNTDVRLLLRTAREDLQFKAAHNLIPPMVVPKI